MKVVHVGRMSSFMTLPLVNVVGRVGVEVVSAARGTAEGLADLVLGAQVVDQRLFLGEHIEAHLTDELQAERHNIILCYLHAMHMYKLVNTCTFFGGRQRAYFAAT